ncbi:MAG: DNA adenine methylase [Methanobrevibacter sp.]|jgi:adenine-specific DNA-methyltransferase|nr:DNA adenine methylase [Candidatus Methanoflexus mossambicus]
MADIQQKFQVINNDIKPLTIYGNLKENTHFNIDTLNFKYNNVNKTDKFYIHNRRYLGSKYKLLGFINKVTSNLKNVNSVVDIFAGTGIVADYFNSLNKKIIVNDILESNFIIYHCFFSNKYVDLNKLSDLIKDFNNISGSEITEDNYFSLNFGGTFFTQSNARKIGYIREKIEELDNKNYLNFREKAMLLTSLLYATDKIANTCGHYDAYRQSLDQLNSLKLLMPYLTNNKNNINKNSINDNEDIHGFNIKQNNEIYNMDSNELVKNISADLFYIDPPYNSRQYGDTYHLLENLITWKKPELTGIARKMKDRTKLKSKYCTVNAPKAFDDLINNINSKYILVSYSNMAQKGVGRSNAKISYDEILNSLNKKGNVTIFDYEYKAYTTGKSDIKDHKELLYLCKIE